MPPVFTKKLLAWNKTKNSRKMPWKGEKDPYKIWLSEIILQQTRVEQGLAYYEKFIKNYPTVYLLAKASPQKVFKLWEGLGYYTRCKNLLQTASTISKEYKGNFPREYDEIKKLKGIGPYTAAAIASFAFNAPHAVVDGNVQRVLARYFGITTPIDSNDGKKLFNELAQSLLPKEQAGIYNQAIMDFGAVICKPRQPLCADCIHRKECQAFQFNKQNELPVKSKSIAKKDRWFNYFLVNVKDEIYLRKRSAGDIWENLYEFVLFESPSGLIKLEEQSNWLNSLFGKQKYRIEKVDQLIRQQLSHQNICGQFFIVHIEKPLTKLKGYILVKRSKLSRFPFPGMINSFLKTQTNLPVSQHIK
jgi:A/G-specific adenine glycosylase